MLGIMFRRVVSDAHCGLRALRREAVAKLNRFRDTWRHVRFMLVHSPTSLFTIPGASMCIGGLGALTWLGIDRSLPDGATGVAMVMAAIALVGAQVIQLGLFASTYAVIYLGEPDERLERMWRLFRLEHGLLLSAVNAILRRRRHLAAPRR